MSLTMMTLESLELDDRIYDGGRQGILSCDKKDRFYIYAKSFFATWSFAKLAYDARSIINESYSYDSKAAASTNLASRVDKVYSRTSCIGKIALWILGYRGKNSLSQMSKDLHEIANENLNSSSGIPLSLMSPGTNFDGEDPEQLLSVAADQYPYVHTSSSTESSITARRRRLEQAFRETPGFPRVDLSQQR